MKLAVSNIAWENHDDTDTLKFLRNNSVSGIEVAPTKLWPNWEGSSYKKARAYKKLMEDHGFLMPAMQAIFFGKPELQVFDSTSHVAILEHIKFVANLATGLGNRILIWGAPRNRKRGKISYNRSMKIAESLFYKASEICKNHGCYIGLEHNPTEYGCDFVTNVSEAKEFITLVSHPFLKLHLDSGGIHMCGEDIVETIKLAGSFEHYHISEPMLEPIYGGVVEQKRGIDFLKLIRYDKWVSIEMKKPPSVHLLKSSINYVNDVILGDKK